MLVVLPHHGAGFSRQRVTQKPEQFLPTTPLMLLWFGVEVGALEAGKNTTRIFRS